MLNNYYKYTFLFILSLLFSVINAQEKKIIHATGTSVSVNLSPKEALNEAIEDAQHNAYLKAGITEQVSVSHITYTTENSSNEVKQYFNEIATIESNADIVVDSVYSEFKRFNEFGNMVVTVNIIATVFMHDKKKDTSFFFKISNLKDTYYIDEKISFSVTPSHDGYLKIFAINTDETSIIYPFINVEDNYLSDKQDSLFRKGVPVAFPVHPAYKHGYTVELGNDEELEINNLVFVFLKKDISILKNNVSLKSILTWIYNIPVDERDVQFRSVTIKALQ